MKGFELSTLVMIVTACICSCKSNYDAITTTTTPHKKTEFWYVYEVYEVVIYIRFFFNHLNYVNAIYVQER